MSHHISVSDSAVLYDVHRGLDADAVANDRAEVSAENITLKINNIFDFKLQIST